MSVRTRKPTSTHHYWHDPETGCCREPGLHGGVCNLPRENAHHHVPAIPDGLIEAEARRLGERDDP